MDMNERHGAAQEQAAQWWLRLQSQEMSRVEREQFVDWLRESTVHVAEMLRVASVHGALEQFEHWTRLSTQGAEDAGTIVPLRRGDEDAPAVTKRQRFGWPIAAALACIVITATLVLAGLRGQTIETDRGERREVVLEDGSVVQVDPESRLRVKFNEHSRRVVLDAGRALFRVAKNPDRPFLVRADETTVRAVGTAFGVERKGEDVVVTVAEGKVAVERATAAAPSLPARNAETDSSASGAAAHLDVKSTLPAEVFLTANEQVTVATSDPSAQIRKVDVTRALAWAEGRLVFEDTVVAEVVAQFNRYNRIQLHVDDEQLAQRRINGVFNAADPESFIAFVQSTTTVRVDRSRAADIVITADR